MRNQAERASFLVLLVGAAGAGLSGCVDANHRLTVGDEQKLRAFEGEQIEARRDDAPSLLGVDRSNWAPVTFHVPSDGVIHRPNYRTHWLDYGVTARAGGKFPTATSAYELGKSGSESQITEGLVGPVNAVFDMLTVPVLLFAEPQTLEMRSPYRGYELQPRGSILPEEGAGEAGEGDADAGAAGVSE
jgi:hypothetical protein